MKDRAVSPRKITLSILADQLGARVGGGRFTTGFLRALLANPETWERVERLFILVTQNESTDHLGSLPPGAVVLKRRFPSRLRSTWLAPIFAKSLPVSDIAHGPFFYVFPRQARCSVVTFLDASFLDNRFHPSRANIKSLRIFSRMVLPNCHAFACISQAALIDLKRAFPNLSHKCVRIYPGVDSIMVKNLNRRSTDVSALSPYILIVGTIEPRKNYERILDAYEYFLSEQGQASPDLVIVGRRGWMCDATVERIKKLQSCGKLHWVNNATDEELALYYRNATLFTYLSIYEGFGYPPFEAALAQIPMVLSNQSAIGEIWSGYACCVDPTDVGEIVRAWKWGLDLDSAQRQSVIEQQKKRAGEFTWERCVSEYLQLYESLADGKQWDRL